MHKYINQLKYVMIYEKNIASALDIIFNKSIDCYAMQIKNYTKDVKWIMNA